ncbi:STAS domain-containing protein [Streptomyces sp. 1222.5]|uniref:STAS domain-containing protein n=1 Tax=Streptomyces sp. 1222.5 TaxID=1881026 RepID=UPI003EBED78E
MHRGWLGDTVLLRLAGELDVATAPLVEKAVVTCLVGHPPCIHLDLTGLTFCDGTGLRSLQRFTDAAQAADVAVCLTGIHPNLQRTLTHFKNASPWSPPMLPC